MRMQVLTCRSCHRDWERAAVRGRRPHTCPRCKQEAAALAVVPAQRGVREGKDLVESAESIARRHQMVKKLTNYRLAIEIALPAIKLGRYDEAIDALERVRG